MADSWKARETLLPASRPVVTGGKGGAPLLGSAFFSCHFLISQLFCWNLRLLCSRGIPSPCPSVFLSPQTGFAAYRLPSSIPDSFAGFHFLAPAFPEPSRSSLLPPSGCGSPSRELALPRPPWTTIPSEPSGRRLGCGQVTGSPDLRIAVGSPGGELSDCPGLLLTSSRVEPKCPRNLKSFSTSLF